MSNRLPGIYVIARDKEWELRVGGKTLMKGKLQREALGLTDRGLLASELTLGLKLPKMPTVLTVIKGGLEDVKPMVPTLPVILPPPPDGPRTA